MKSALYIVIFLILSQLIISCEQNLIHEEFNNTTIGNYDAFWSEFDRYYGAFEAKHVNWDSLNIIYRNKVLANPTDQVLYDSFKAMLTTLNDGHADLYSPLFRELFLSWNRRDKLFFTDTQRNTYVEITELHDIIKKTYLKNKFQESVPEAYWKFIFGKIDFFGVKVGYLYIPSFKSYGYPYDFLQMAVDSFKTVDAVIIDIRFNGGGSTEGFVKTMNLFASEKKLYMKSKFRNGPKHSDFTEMYEHYIIPDNNGVNPKNIAILANSFTASSAEHFLLALKSQNNVFTVGDTTRGAFSQVWGRVLPNGWQFRCGSQVVYSPDGKLLTDKNGIYLEGKGIVPDFLVQDQIAQIRSGHDLALDEALFQIYMKQKVKK